MQLPPAQVPVPHELLQRPQLLGSVFKLTQSPLHRCWFGGQVPPPPLPPPPLPPPPLPPPGCFGPLPFLGRLRHFPRLQTNPLQHRLRFVQRPRLRQAPSASSPASWTNVAPRRLAPSNLIAPRRSGACFTKSVQLVIRSCAFSTDASSSARDNVDGRWKPVRETGTLLPWRSGSQTMCPS